MKVAQQKLADKQAAFCRIFAHPRRILILWTLAEREKSVSEIAMSVEASLQNTSQHLRLMREMGILDFRRDGQTVFYHVVEDGPLAECPLGSQVGENQVERQRQRDCLIVK
jgi:DNA-binding transcriptional ArsR family regulator